MAVNLGGAFALSFSDPTYVTATNLYAYLMKGNAVYDWTNGQWVELSSGWGSLGSDHRATLTWRYDNATKIGFVVSLAAPATRLDDIKPSVYDLVFYDGTSYLGGAGVHIAAGGNVTINS